MSLVGVLAPRPALAEACAWSFPVGDDPSSPAPLADNHPVGGMNLPSFGTHLGADFWSGGGCTDYGQTVYAVADGEVVEIVDALGSYLDVVVIRHEDPEVGPVYSMYGHIERDADLVEGQLLARRDPIGIIDDVLAYFSPCHLHFELLSQEAFEGGPFCNGCEAAGYHVSPGYDQQQGVTEGSEPSGDGWLEVDDGIEGNRWYFVDAFIEARLDKTCASCGDGVCDRGESSRSCPSDCADCGAETGGACSTSGGEVEPASSTGGDAPSPGTGADVSSTSAESTGEGAGDVVGTETEPTTSGSSSLSPERGPADAGCSCRTAQGEGGPGRRLAWVLLGLAVGLPRRRTSG